MNPPTYPDADHTAPSRLTTAIAPAPPPLPCSCRTEPTSRSRTAPGAMSPMLAIRSSVVDWPASPTSDTTTRIAGKIDRIE